MSDPVLSQYSFWSWMRRGLASQSGPIDSLGDPARTLGAGRLTAAVQLDVTANGAPLGSPVSRSIQVYGPGDVAGVDRRLICRTDPRPGALDFEPNYLAAIEFDSVDFPWRFTPAAANQDRLRPWIFLIVLAEGEFVESQASSSIITNILLSALPDLRQSWAWAHVQATHAKDEADPAGLLNQSGEPVLSRLVCPRKLKPRTRYHAFLVPAFEAGRQAGLGASAQTINGVDGWAPAWNKPSSNGGSQQSLDRLPYYYRWDFGTGDDQDFESLVRRLKATDYQAPIGDKILDIQDVGYEVAPSAADGTRTMQGVLVPIAPEPPDWSDPDFVPKLTDVLNYPAERARDPNAEKIVGPPIYGQWHARESELSAASPLWLKTMNLDPAGRAMAGLGVQVVQKQQPSLMASAWSQLGAVEKANQLLRQAQLARSVATRIYEKHLKSLASDALLTLTAPLHGKVLSGSATLRAALARSPVPRGTLWPFFRRLARARGTTMQRWNPAGAAGRVPFLKLLNDGSMKAAERPGKPDAMGTASDASDKFYPNWLPVWLRPWLNLLPWLLLGLGLLCLLVAGVLWLLGSAGNVVRALVLVGVLLLLLAYWVYVKWLPLWQAAQDVRDENLLEIRRIRETPSRPGFKLVPKDAPPADARSGGQDDAQATAFRMALLDVQSKVGLAVPELPEFAASNLEDHAAAVKAALDPEKTLPFLIGKRIALQNPVRSQSVDPLESIMAAPKFTRPMVEPLTELAPDSILPGLQSVPPDTMGLLRTNQRAVEAYMLGLNHEMARELLWRGYPTDQRGTYFAQFWDIRSMLPLLSPGESVEDLEDVWPIHTWAADSKLGAHAKRSDNGFGDNLVLLVRSELFRKYPNTTIYAQKAAWADDLRQAHVLADDGDPASFQVPILRGNLDPDVTFFGFGLKPEDARGNAQDPGWFFVIQQHPTQPRFGFHSSDVYDPTVPARWEDLRWGQLAAGPAQFQSMTFADLDAVSPTLKSLQLTGDEDKNVHWASGAADMAYIALQRPVRLAVHASRMLPKGENAPA